MGQEADSVMYPRVYGIAAYHSRQESVVTRDHSLRVAARVTALLVMLFIGAVPGRAQQAVRPFSVQTEAAEHLVEEGRSALLQFRLNEAERVFKALNRMPGSGAAAYHHLALSSMLKLLMTDVPAYYDEFYRRADSLQLALREVDEPWRTYLDAENQLQRMIVYAKQGSNVKAAFAAKGAYGRFRNVVKRFPSFYEAYKGMGLLHLSIGSLPSTYRRILGLLGFSGEVEQGLRELRLAAEKSAYNREEAHVLLALVNGVMYDQPEQAVPPLRTLYEQNNQSPLFAFFYGFMLLKTRDAAEAERVLSSAVRKDERAGYFFLDYNEHHLAEAHFKQNEFVQAEEHYKRYLSRHKGPALKAPTYLGLGLSLEMQNRRAEALKQYAMVKSTRGMDTDDAAEREAKRRMARPMTEPERQLLLASNAFGSGDYSGTERILRALWDSDSITEGERAETAYRLGRLYEAQQKYDEAIAAYELAIEHAQDPNARWAPWANFYIAQIYADQGRRQEAARAYKAALEYKGKYDYYQALEQSAKAGLKKL